MTYAEDLTKASEAHGQQVLADLKNMRSDSQGRSDWLTPAFRVICAVGYPVAVASACVAAAKGEVIPTVATGTLALMFSDVAVLGVMDAAETWKSRAHGAFSKAANFFSRAAAACAPDEQYTPKS